NVIYSYPLARAMADGFVKEPAVATRESFRASDYTLEQLERLKLEDGIRIHEHTKVELEIYAGQTGQPQIKPFMLVVAQDTAHADKLVAAIKADDFFDGRYRDRVITVHSNQRDEERDDTVAQLLSVERPDNPTEIVVHVNMLKEGWDVTNLYTIVPLRAADSRPLVEQSIGRGLRLPYGQRVGVSAVDRLTIVAHDRFQAIIDEARRPGSPLHWQEVIIERDIGLGRKETRTVQPAILEELSRSKLPGAPQPAQQPPPPFSPSEQQVARATLEIIKDYASDPRRVPNARHLNTPAIQAEIAARVAAVITPPQPSLPGMADQLDIPTVVARTLALYAQRTIDIPR